MQRFSEAIISYLQTVNEDTVGYYGKGYVSIYSLLTSPMVTGNGQGNPWTIGPNHPFDGYALYHVLQYMDDNLDYPPVEVACDVD
eukprot:1104848-Heterocapsa_arctica.AAC.2